MTKVIFFLLPFNVQIGFRLMLLVDEPLKLLALAHEPCSYSV